MTLKNCVVCDKEFNALRSAKTCSKECSKQRRRLTLTEYYHKDRDKWREYASEYQKNHREERLKYMQEWYRRNLKKAKEIKLRASQKWSRKNPEKRKIISLVYNNPKRYPLDDKCIFCDTTEHLEHAHLDYEDDGCNYVTTCHRCNLWMEKT